MPTDTEITAARLQAADALARHVRSFLDSLPYMAPEAMETQATIKLAVPLRAYREAGQ